MSVPQRTALGLLEIRGEAAGVMALDAAVKGAGVKAAVGRAVCPGKFLVFLTGTVAAVENGLTAGASAPGLVKVASLILPAVHPDVWPALTANQPVTHGSGIGIVETFNASATLEAADTMAKSTSISLLRVRLSSGLGGRGFALCTGSTSNLEIAVAAAQKVLGYNLTASRIVAAPHPRLWELVI